MTDKPWRPGTGQKIEKLYAWIAVEADGGEGVVGIEMADGVMMAAVGADRARMESLRPIVRRIHEISGMPILLKVFSGGVTIDDISTPMDDGQPRKAS